MARELGLELPSFSSDLDRVSAYSTADQSLVGRLFVPLETSIWGEYQSWSDAARIAGVELTASTRWTEIKAAQRGAEIGRPQVGTIDQKTIQLLVSALGKAAPDASSGSFLDKLIMIDLGGHGNQV